MTFAHPLLHVHLFLTGVGVEMGGSSVAQLWGDWLRELARYIEGLDEAYLG